MYLKSSDDPFIGRIDRIFKQDKGEVQVLLQVYYYYYYDFFFLAYSFVFSFLRLFFMN